MFLTCCEFDRKGYQTGTEPTGPNQVYDQAKYEDNLFFISLKQTKKGEAGGGGGERTQDTYFQTTLNMNG